MTYCLDFPRAHGQPLGSAILKQSIEDFAVTELLGYAPTGVGEHLFLKVKKRGANTGWVSEQLASKFGLRYFDVGYCGKKDRHAVTEQWFSCWLPGKTNGDIQDLLADLQDADSSTGIEGVEITASTWHNKKLRRGEHAANRFNIVLRDLEIEDPDALETRLQIIAEQGFPNYFGPQRFGWDGHNLVQADQLIEAIKDEHSANGKPLRKKLSRKQRDMTVSAVRAYMFNVALAELVNNNGWQEVDETWVYGTSPHRDIEIPPVEPALRDFAGLVERLEIKAQPRQCKILPANFDWETNPEQLVLTFDLPSGAYATSLINEVLNVRDPV